MKPLNWFRERGSSVGLASVSVWRNKRRSLSMVSGMVVGGAILCMIMIYSSVLIAATFDSAIENVSYEVRFDVKGDYNETEFDSFVSELGSDKRVTSAVGVYGSVLDLTSAEGGFMWPALELYLEDYERDQQRTYSSSELSVLVVPDNFMDTPIGQKIADSLVSGDTDLSTAPNILMPDAIAREFKYAVGSTLQNQTLVIEGDKLQTDIVVGDPLELRVGGIYRHGGGSAGIFSGDFDQGSVIISEATMNALNAEMMSELKANGMRFVAVQLNRNELDFSDLKDASEEIDKFVNSIEKANPEFMGMNSVEQLLAPIAIMAIFIQIFDIILAIPALVLALYLISFGLDLALEERRKEVQILKVSGGSPKQIQSLVRIESFIMASFGLVAAYVIGSMGAWVMAAGVGYMRFDFSAAGDIAYYLQIHTTALIVTALFPGGIMIYQAHKKTSDFLQQEVVEGTSTEKWHKEGFLTRTKLDLVFLGLGTISFVTNLAESIMHTEIGEGVWFTLLDFFGPLMLWIGGSVVIMRIVKRLPFIVKPIMSKLGVVKDVRMLVGSSLSRTASNMPRLAIIISLTISLAMLAAVQGTTGEFNDERVVEWNVGADLQITTSGMTYEYETSLDTVGDSVETVSLMQHSVQVLNDRADLFSMDVDKYADVGIFHSDSFARGTELSDLRNLDEGAIPRVLIGKYASEVRDYFVGDVLKVEMQVINRSTITPALNFSAIGYEIIEFEAEVAGVFDHLPGAIGQDQAIMDRDVLLSIVGYDTLSVFEHSVVFGFVCPPCFSLMNIGESENAEDIRTSLLERDEVLDVITLERKLDELRSMDTADFGIPGLLSANFLVSVFSATLATFALMSLLMDKRRKEFGVVRALGGSSRQIQKVAVAEISALLITSITWGALLGAALSYSFNGLFWFIGVFMGSSELDRVVSFPWMAMFATLIGSFCSMVAATLLSIRKASSVPVVEVLHEL